MSLYADILTYLSPAILFLGSFAGLKYRRKLDVESRLIWIYLLLALAIDIAARIIAVYHDNNLFLWSFLATMELLVFGQFYTQLVKKKSIAYGLILAGLLYIVFDVFWANPQEVSSFQSYAKVVSASMIVLLSLFYIIYQMRTDVIISWEKLNLNLAILTYFTLNVILLLPINFLINEGSGWAIYIWYLYLSITVLFYIYLSFYLWRSGKNRRP